VAIFSFNPCGRLKSFVIQKRRKGLRQLTLQNYFSFVYVCSIIFIVITVKVKKMSVNLEKNENNEVLMDIKNR